MCNNSCVLLSLYCYIVFLCFSFFPQIFLDDVTSIESRRSLVLSLSESSTTLKQHETLASLLEHWPDSSWYIALFISAYIHFCATYSLCYCSIEEFTECWIAVLSSIASYPKDCYKVVHIRAGLQDMNSQVSLLIVTGLDDVSIDTIFKTMQ